MTNDELNNMVSVRFPGDGPYPYHNPAEAGVNRQRAVAALRKLAAMRMETLALYTAFTVVEPFHASNAIWRILVGGNRSSKTTAGLIEDARAFAGCDPYNKYKPRDGKILLIGLDEKHLADPIARKLFQPGAFKLIRDEITNLPRFLRPDPNNPQQLDPYDEAYREKWFDAPPIIPPRILKRPIAWVDRAAGVPAACHSITDWTIEFRSSKSAPKQGDEIDLGHIDESIVNGQHFVEMSRGLVSRAGLGIWTATPQNVSHYLRELKRRNERGDQNVYCAIPTIYDNYTISEARREEFVASIPSLAERRIRIMGEFAFTGLACYPTYDPQFVHGCEPHEVPQDATRYFILDPGYQHCATVFMAVDREEKHKYVYAAFEIRNLSSVHEWAAMVKQHQGPHKFEAAIIDGQAGTQHPMSGGDTLAERYWRALQQAGVSVRTFGPDKTAGFFPGQRDIVAREDAVREMLAVRHEGPFAGTPTLMVSRGCCPELDRQIEYACHNTMNDDKRNYDQPQDLVTSLEYGCAWNLYYHEPESVADDPSLAIWEQFQAEEDAAKLRERKLRLRRA